MKTFSFQNGDTIPAIGLGTWLSRPNEVYNAVLSALKSGYRHIDCAYIYGNEAEVGNALTEAFSNNIVKREDVFITSKLWNSYHEPDKVKEAIKKSLKDLQLDYLDLYLIHWPMAFCAGKDNAETSSDLLSLSEVPLADTWQAMIKLKEEGLTKHIGVSNFSAEKIEGLVKATSVIPEMNQVELHPYFQQNDLVRFCHKNNVLITAYSPLGSNRLTSKGEGPAHEEIIRDIAAKHNCTPAQVTLAWGINRDTIVIPKSVNPERIKENSGALNIHLSAEEMDQIAQLDQNERLSNGSFAVFQNGPYTVKGIWNE